RCQPAALARQRFGRLAEREEGADRLVGTRKNGRPVAKVGALVAQQLQSLRRSHGALVRMIDVPGWGADPTFVVEDVSEKERGLRFGEKADAAWRMAWPMHHGQSCDRFAVLEEARRPARARHHESGQPRWQPVGQAPQRHPLLRAAWLQVGCVGLVDSETRARRLAESERGPRIIVWVGGGDAPYI